MNFKLSEEQKQIQLEARAFANEVIAPRSIEMDQTAKFPRDIFEQIGKKGWLGIPFAKEYGGMGKDTLTYSIVAEEIGRADVSVGLSYVASVSIGASPIAMYGTEEQKQKYLVPLAQGKELSSFGLTEENAGSDASGVQTTAILDGDEYVLNGVKRWITNSNYASVITVAAVTEQHANGRKRISSFIVPTNTPGVSVTSPYKKMGARASDTGQVVLHNVRIPKENLLGRPNFGMKQFLTILNGGRISIAAISVGLAQAALDKALAHAKTRKQFGRPISDFQAVQFKLADMAMELELARNMVYKAAWLKDQGKPYIQECAYAKLFASETAFRSANQAIQILGGTGYMQEAEVERYLRDAKILEIGEGTSEIQRLVIARQLGC
ncbi:MAG: acyl-CoA dehydrogenase family protein [Bacillota bacterium]|nr:acyl-CoA dehydrogenase family protein [Bacillota bacterium]